MRGRTLLSCIIVAASCGFAASSARAQYKNTSYGFDVGYIEVTTPSVEKDGQLRDPPLPRRFRRGFHIGGEINFKLDADHWWFSGRLNFPFMFYAPAGSIADRTYDADAKRFIGTVMGLQAGINIRYLFFTDQFRPYAQLGLDFTRFFNFKNPEAGTGAAFPHANALGFHVQPGIELIVARDIALHFYLDAMYWIAVNAPGNFAFAPGIGMLFFT